MDGARGAERESECRPEGWENGGWEGERPQKGRDYVREDMGTFGSKGGGCTDRLKGKEVIHTGDASIGIKPEEEEVQSTRKQVTKYGYVDQWGQGNTSSCPQDPSPHIS